ncbi:MAG TPA: LytTR family DNA-binding domain-containing protein [Thermoanaerobaculia bacterium]|nr:LytTR family DNA-binding domain-containing protein [Thermoanaerobaculia bacterium]
MTDEASQPLRVLIVDDEEPARRLLAELLAGEDDVELVGECRNGFEAVQSIQSLAQDLVLLDVQMPKLDGFEVLELLESPPMVVFVTAYDEYAVRAFEVHAVDYLLKPVSAERLHAALDRVRARLAADEQPPAAAALARAARPASGYLERVLVRDGEKVHVVPVMKVDYFEAQGDVVVLRAGPEKLRKPTTLNDLERELDPGRFLRVHRSYILNLDRLAGLELYAKDSRVAILKDGTRLPVSRPGYSRLRELL